MKKIITLLLLITLVSSCTTTKNNKAVVRVLSNKDLTDRVGKVWEKSNPCVPVSPVYIKGKDSIRVDSTYADEQISELNSVIDSLYNFINSRPNGERVNRDSLRRVLLIEVMKNCHPKTIYNTRVDTVKKRDLRHEISLQSEIDNLAGQLQQKDSQLSESRRSEKIKSWIIILLCGLIGISVFLKIKNIL